MRPTKIARLFLGHAIGDLEFDINIQLAWIDLRCSATHGIKSQRPYATTCRFIDSNRVAKRHIECGSKLLSTIMCIGDGFRASFRLELTHLGNRKSQPRY